MDPQMSGQDQMMPAGASIERTVEWADTDAAGHQHNSAIMRWVEAAEAELFRRLELPDYFPSAPRVQQVINYRAKLWFGQRVTAALTVQKIGRTSMTFAFEVHGQPHEKSAGGLAAYGTFTTAYVPEGADSAAPWPEHIRTAVARGSAVPA
ncbi:thioesterase family domain protein [Arthrobacter crystallopoietes BAB-32]|uniref:Thioesterase family domain protein n=1 Tax=Arthrobacter crystallopoietes BAB-32 TaxID=1246476 RepID=N1UZ88_9MICC|nr:thioesterase family protein [Arthrobacter crystallopoietes]EMY33147.1 thioesterase family domain protein [Arthrobacter crystallopoietes BAB-32]